MSAPIGALYLDATKRAAKKSGGHHSSGAKCGCVVTVQFFSESSHTVQFSRCSEHPKEARRRP